MSDAKQPRAGPPLTERQVQIIRDSPLTSSADLADEFGCAPSTVRMARAGLRHAGKKTTPA